MRVFTVNLLFLHILFKFHFPVAISTSPSNTILKIIFFNFSVVISSLPPSKLKYPLPYTETEEDRQNSKNHQIRYPLRKKKDAHISNSSFIIGVTKKSRI